MGKKINKKEIVVCAVILAICMGAGAVGVAMYDSNIDHLNEYCPLNNIFGVEHQIDLINDEYSIKRAVYATNGEVTLVSGLTKIENDDEMVYAAPVGYTLSNGQAKKTIKLNGVEEGIVIIEGVPVSSDGQVLNGLTKKSDIQLYDPRISNIIEKPSKSK